MSKEKANTDKPVVERLPDSVRFEVYGQEMLEKMVRASGNSGRVYLPTNWVGRQVKIIRVD